MTSGLSKEMSEANMNAKILGPCPLLLTALFGCLCAGGCANDSKVISQAVQTNQGLSPAVEKDPQVTAYMQRVGQRIQKAAAEMDRAHQGPDNHFNGSDNSWMFVNAVEFHLVNSETLNAFTTGGQHVYVYRKLMDICDTEDQLAAVMAHEFGHIYCRHVQAGMNRQIAMLGAAGLAGVAGYALGGKDNGGEYAQAGAGAAMVAGNFVGMGFTRKDEAQADEWGFQFYTRAGWDPKQFGVFFKKMIDLGYDKTPEMMSDHPSLASRYEIANKRVAALPASASQWRQPEFLNAPQFKDMVAVADRAGKSMPTDQQVASASKVLQALPRSCLTPVMQPDQRKAQQELLQKAEQDSKKKAAANQ